MIDAIARWIDQIFPDSVGFSVSRGKVMRLLLSRLRHPVQMGADDWSVKQAVRERIIGDREFALDFVDSILSLDKLAGERDRSDLQLELNVGGSVWRVAEHGLQRRVDSTAQKQADAATSVPDAASNELRTAWAAAYGRNPDASDAWDHAIKAVEEALKPVIVPGNPGATLGGVVGPLRGVPTNFKMALRDNGLSNTVDAVETFEDMLHFIWPNPDRHGGADKRTPSIEEARAVVQLAVTVVQWARAGMIGIR